MPIISGTVRTEETWRSKHEAESEEESIHFPVLNGNVRGQGLDYVRNDPDGRRMRLDAGVVVE